MIKRFIISLTTLLAISLGAMGTTILDEPSDSLSTSSELDEIVVKAYQKNITVDGTLTTVKIKGSAYQNIGSVSRMLPNIPDLISKNGQIEVVGIGRPLFIVDGREIKDQSELEMLRSDNIKEIKIEKNPGGTYSATYPAVVYIITIRQLKDYLHLAINNDLMKYRKWQDAPSLNIGIKAGKFTSTLAYKYYYTDAVIKETYFRNIYQNDLPVFSLNQPRHYRYTSRNFHTLSWLGEYQFNSTNRLGVYYHLYHSPNHIAQSGFNNIDMATGRIDIPFVESTLKADNLNSFTAMYAFKQEKHDLQITQDIAMRHTNSDRKTLEGNGDDNHIVSNSHSQYEIYTSTLRYLLRLPRNYWFGLSGKYNYTYSRTKILSGGATNYDIPAINNLDVKEHNPQGAIYITKWFGNFYISPGVRYEFTSREITNTQSKMDPRNIKDCSSKFFPWLSLYYKNSRGVTLYSYYSRSNLQPTFSQLNSGIVYMDPYSYYEGNPELRNQTGNSLTLGGSFRNISLSATYRHYSDYIASIETQAHPESFIISMHEINLPSFREWRIAGGYSFAIHSFNASVQVELNCPHAIIPVDRDWEKRDFVTCSYNVNLSYQPLDWLSIYTNYTHQGHSERLLTTQRSVDAWNLGITGVFFGGKLSAAISFNDILNRANYNNLTYQYRNIKWGTRGSGDSRGVWFTLSYTIFNKEISGKTSPGNSSDLKRTM